MSNVTVRNVCTRADKAIIFDGSSEQVKGLEIAEYGAFRATCDAKSELTVDEETISLA